MCVADLANQAIMIGLVGGISYFSFRFGTKYFVNKFKVKTNTEIENS